MDKTDHKILEILQKNGRISNIDLAEQVNLSPTPCLKRLRKLESSGVISGYRAVVDPTKIGVNISSLVLIRMNDHTRESVNRFVKAIKKISAITECYMATGRVDYIARIYARDFKHYEEIIRDDIARLPNMMSMETLFIIGDNMQDNIIR
ncbi:MAG: Lrp/AsnC family transcriptional regulator [Litorimonas sp.]